MLNSFSLGKVAQKVFKLPSFRFRDKDAEIHNASDATKCSRAVTYKALKTKESNPVDTLGQFKMRFGNWLERGLNYDILGPSSLFDVILLGKQIEVGEHGTFYGTSWHGYVDDLIGIRDKETNTITPVAVEIKTKVGYGAVATLKKTPWSKEFVIPTPDTVWGQSQQIGLYLRDLYRKTKDNPSFSKPVRDGVLLQLLYGDGLACFVEYLFEYYPENDTVVCYRVQCEEYPEISSDLNIVVDLKEVASHWRKQDQYIREKTLAPPSFERRYVISDERIKAATIQDLERAVKGQLVIGDMQCKYCVFRDQCAKDLGTDLTYNLAEKQVLKNTANGKSKRKKID